MERIMTNIKINVDELEKELDWFKRVLETRTRLYFCQECEYSTIYDIPTPVSNGNSSFYRRIIDEHSMSFDERLVLILALIPHVRPQLLDNFFIHNKNFNRPFTEFGGWKGNTHSGFLPTGETAAYLLAGKDIHRRFEAKKLFGSDHFFAKNNILRLEDLGNNEPYLSGALFISPEYLNRITIGVFDKPDFSINFPAKRITSTLTWDDLVLPAEVFEEIENITGWARHAKTILEEWGLKKVIKPGYRSLFYGPPGTGKTLTANLIGQITGSDVYRIDLSMVVSKYIGETEKNLASVFDQAENRDWVLFFDEADALFGKRTQTSSSHDRYANQEISYLLQRIEDFSGVVILATNLKANIDDAFARRFQSVIYFPMPDADQRLLLWKSIVKGRCRLSEEINLEEIAEKYELSGGAIINVVRYGTIRVLRHKRKFLSKSDIIKGITRELMKEGKTV